jgi:hypothetical protein
MDGHKWAIKSFFLGSNSLANHGDKLSCMVYYLPTNNLQQVNYLQASESAMMWDRKEKGLQCTKEKKSTD